MKKNLKILLVHSFFSPVGGAELVVYNTFKLLKEKGEMVCLFSSNKKPYFEEDYEYLNYFANYINPQGKFFESLNIFKKLKIFLSYYWNFQAQENFSKMLEKIKPDVVHFNILGNLSYSVIKLCIDRNIPIVKTCHTSEIICPIENLYTGKKYCKNICCKNFNTLPCIINNCYRNIFFSFGFALKNLFEKLTGFNNKISKYITPSIALKEVISKNIDKNKITVIENFLENEFLNIEPDFSQKKYFLFSGRLEKVKGVDYLLKAMNNLKEIELHIVGTGSYENELKQYVKENGLSNVKFLGFLKREELIEEYKNAIALIVPSVCFESFGMIIIEAFACSTPVIAANIGGMAEIIEHNKTGFLVEPENSEEIEKYIKFLWENKDKAIEMGKNAKKIVQEKYNQDIYYEKLMKVYEEVLKK